MCAAQMVPTLAAGPFRLRPFMLDDVDLIREASADPYIPVITTVPSVFTDEEGRRFIERQWSRPEEGIGYSFAIAEADTDRAIGHAGLWLKHISRGRAEVGYWVAGSARGRRAAAFAARALAQWAHRDVHVPRVELTIEPWNTASMRAAETAGFQREGLLRSWQELGGARKDMYMYSLLPADPLPGIA